MYILLINYLLVLSFTEKKVPQRNSRAELHSHNNCTARAKPCKLASLRQCRACYSLAYIVGSFRYARVSLYSILRACAKHNSGHKSAGKARNSYLISRNKCVVVIRLTACFSSFFCIVNKRKKKKGTNKKI